MYDFLFVKRGNTGTCALGPSVQVEILTNALKIRCAYWGWKAYRTTTIREVEKSAQLMTRTKRALGITLWRQE
jgi:hypothetical protein